MGLDKASKMPCKADNDGNLYITINKYVRGFAITVIAVSVVVLIFMPMYIEDTGNTAIVLFVMAIINIIWTTRLLLLKYTLTDNHLARKAFTKKIFAYDELKELSKTNSMYIVSKPHTGELTLRITNKVKLSYWIFYGSCDFAARMENKMGVRIEKKDETSSDKLKQLLLFFIPMVILGVILFLLSNAPS